MKHPVVALTALAALLVQLAAPAAALAGRGGKPDKPGKPSRPFVYEAANGFVIEIEPTSVGRRAFTASATLTGPTGERMTFDFADGGRFGPTVLLDGHLLVGYELNARGRITALTVDDGRRTVRSRRAPGRRADTEAYLVLAEALAANHSPAFLSQLDVALRSLQQEGAVPVQLRDFIECALGVTGYILSIWGLITGCTITGVPTLGASCLFAILAHETATASAILACFP